MTPLQIFKKSSFALWALLTLLSFKALAQPAYPTTPDQAELIYTDLKHFCEAYAELATNGDTLQVLKTRYFDRGSAGLKEYIRRHQLSPELIRDALRTHPERYVLLPGFLDSISGIEQMYSRLMKDFGAVVPDAMYPPTYLLVGANRGIGQASGVGQLITVTRAVDNLPKLQKLMVHELAHFQQAKAMGLQNYAALYSKPDNLLGMCLREGGAEFVTWQVVGEITQTRALEFIEKEEDYIKSKFLQDLETDTQNKEYWLRVDPDPNGTPGLLGYALGYRINREYFNQATDKASALQEILRMDDTAAFVASSGYFIGH